MDPRPFTYQYRKPRLSNPTYLSGSLYDSINYLSQFSGSKRFMQSERVDKIHNKSQSYTPYQLKQTQRQIQNKSGINSRRDQQISNSLHQNGQQQLAKSSFVQPTNNYVPKYTPMYQSNLYDSNRNKSSKPVNRSFSQDSQKYGGFSNVGQKIMQPFPPGKDQDYIFQRQNLPYNIINCSPRDHASIHRKYPKISLENKLLQTGQYRQNPQYD